MDHTENFHVDCAGPFQLRDGKARNRGFVKGYVSIFVCMSSKAIHLESSVDLTTEEFLNAFKRFVSRRGFCSVIYSDNETNFKRANNEIISMYILLNTDYFQHYISQQGITWKFMLSQSPRMGGLWEADVKAMKLHL